MMMGNLLGWSCVKCCKCRMAGREKESEKEGNNHDDEKQDLGVVFM